LKFDGQLETWLKQSETNDQTGKDTKIKVSFQRHYSFSSSGAVSTDRGIVSATKAANCFSYGKRFTANARRPSTPL